MRDALAERLLAAVMNWTAEDVARERPVLQALAALKFDEYQQFSPGMRFVESLALWLEQFREQHERQTAYSFVLERLVFLSYSEMAHFTAIAYPDVIRPMLIEQAALDAGLSSFRIRQVLATENFARLQGACLFFGLSDGARIDLFRRSNKDLSHEQIFTSYELSDEKVREIRKWLDGRAYEGETPALILLDDFSASGSSCLMADGDTAKGKVSKFLRRIQGNAAWKAIVGFPKTRLFIMLYVATERALGVIEEGAAALRKEFGAVVYVRTVQKLESSIAIPTTSNEPIAVLARKYYDPKAKEKHPEWGGDIPLGYAECGLPLILHHNSPNNSLFVLWAEDSAQIQPLFPRVSRHRREP
jgi:hypothetical protein